MSRSWSELSVSLFPSATALLNCIEVVKGSLAARNTLFPPVTEISRAIQTVNHAWFLQLSSTKVQTDRRIPIAIILQKKKSMNMSTWCKWRCKEYHQEEIVKSSQHMQCHAIDTGCIFTTIYC